MPAPLLVLAADDRTATELAEGLVRTGLEARPIGSPEALVTAASTSGASLVLLTGPLDGPIVQRALSALSSDAATVSVPVVVATPGTPLDGKFVRAFRSGVVEQLGLPLDFELATRRLRALPGELRNRPGAIGGLADKRELTLFLSAVKSTQRSGALQVNPGAPGAGTALFVRGVLQSAEAATRTGQDALLHLLASPLSRWVFTDLSGGGGDGREVVIELAPAPGGEGEDLALDDEPLDVVEGTLVEEPAPPHLLLVDDDPDLRRMFSLLLKKRGFEVTTAADGVEGADHARRGTFDVVVADLSMPRLDGWGLLRQLRDDFATREMPVAFLSCHDDYRDQLKALNSGAQAYLSKSVRQDALAQQVRELLQPRQRARQQLASGADEVIKLDEVGGQWLLRELHRMSRTGLLSAKDGWATYYLFFDEGNPVHAVAQAGVHQAEGERAFNAFVASRGAEAQFRDGERAPAKSLSGGLATLLDAAVRLLNRNDRAAKEAMLVQAKRIEVDAELYALYRQVAGENATEAARLLCDERLTPGEVIARMDASPIEVEELVRDLVRRGVVTLG